MCRSEQESKECQDAVGSDLERRRCVEMSRNTRSNKSAVQCQTKPAIRWTTQCPGLHVGCILGMVRVRDGLVTISKTVFIYRWWVWELVRRWQLRPARVWTALGKVNLWAHVSKHKTVTCIRCFERKFHPCCMQRAQPVNAGINDQPFR